MSAQGFDEYIKICQVISLALGMICALSGTIVYALRNEDANKAYKCVKIFGYLASVLYFFSVQVLIAMFS